MRGLRELAQGRGRALVGDEGGPGSSPPAWAYVGLGLEIALPVALGAYAGYRLDRLWNTGPWMLLTGAILGIAVAFYLLFRSVALGRGAR